MSTRGLVVDRLKQCSVGSQNSKNVFFVILKSHTLDLNLESKQIYNNLILSSIFGFNHSPKIQLSLTLIFIFNSAKAAYLMKLIFLTAT